MRALAIELPPELTQDRQLVKWLPWAGKRLLRPPQVRYWRIRDGCAAQESACFQQACSRDRLTMFRGRRRHDVPWKRERIIGEAVRTNPEAILLERIAWL